MTKEQIYSDFDECLDTANVADFINHLKSLLANYPDDEASLLIGEYLLNNYTAFRADGLATYMEAAIREHPSLALISYPENPFYKLAILCGSKDLYDCYIEEAIEPFVAAMSGNEQLDYFYGLLDLAEKADEMIFNDYQGRIKGLHYNGGVQAEREHLILINHEDYQIMEDVMEKFNSMIGRRDILKDLNKRIDQIDF